MGALLHDLGKTACLGTLNNHAELGADILEDLGYPDVAQVVREHVHLDGDILDPRPLREAEVVNYADKRVLHTRWSPWRIALPTSRCATAALPRPGPASRPRKSGPGPWKRKSSPPWP